MNLSHRQLMPYWIGNDENVESLVEPDAQVLVSGVHVNTSSSASLTGRAAVPLPSDDDLTPATRQVVRGSGADLNVSRMFGGTAEFFPAINMIVDNIFNAQDVNPKLRELIFLRSAKKLSALYEWEAHSVIGRSVGLTDAEIEALSSDGAVCGMSPEYMLICTATDELTVSATLTDETLSRLLERYSAVIVRKLIFMIGWVNLLARFLNGCRVPLETVHKVGTRASPTT